VHLVVERLISFGSLGHPAPDAVACRLNLFACAVAARRRKRKRAAEEKNQKLQSPNFAVSDILLRQAVPGQQWQRDKQH
jgi:hypothetical protein